MAFPFISSGSEKEIDFNFPQDVSKEALSDLNKALKKGDGELTVDALVRYSIAQSSISQDNMTDIIQRIDKVIAKEKKPHIKSLLYYFEALVYENYRDRFARWANRDNPVDEEPTDVSEWDRSQFDHRIMELTRLSMENPEALKQVAVTSLPGIIKCNELGATYVPTLLEFMTIKSIELLEEIDEADILSRALKERWVLDTEGNVPAHIYAISVAGKYLNKEDYEKYQDSEYSALLLNHMSFGNEAEKYKTLKEYVQRFPKSIFTPDVKNKITALEQKRVYVSYPGDCQSTDSIPVSLSVMNTNVLTLNVYRIPDNLVNEYRTPFKELELVRQQTVKVQNSIPFDERVNVMLSPLPYGVYVIAANDLDGKSQTADAEVDVSSYNALRVTDITLLSISHLEGKDRDRIGAVNTKTGKPMPDVKITYPEGTVGTTDSNGMLFTPDTYTGKMGTVAFDNIQVYGSKGDDKYGAPLTYRRLEERYSEGCNAQIYTDLGVYRPGETVNWVAVVYHRDNYSREPVAERELEAIFTDYNNEPIDTVRVTTDQYGRIEGSFVIPKDRMNGVFYIRVQWPRQSYHNALGRSYVNVSEYKTPTFAVTFPDNRHSYVAGEPVKVTGKAETYSGMPVANAEVRLSLVEKEWDWWWWRSNHRVSTHLVDTTVVTDARGMFTFTYEPNVFKENRYSNLYRYAHFNYEVTATVTTDAGETQEESNCFIVGTRRGIELGSLNDNTYLNDKPIKLPLKYNTTDEIKTSAWCTWEVTPVDGKEPVKTGNLNTDDPTIDLTDLPSGQYKIKVHIIDAEPGEEDVDAQRTITIYRKSDKVPPIKDTALWISPIGTNVDKNNTGHITIGVSVPKAYIYHVATTTEEVIGEGWLTYDKGMHDFTVPLPKKPGANVNVQFYTCYDNKITRTTKYLDNPYKAENLKITATSFRDKLTPGDIEHWTFTLTDQNGKPSQGAMMLEMFDKAIASIADNDWSFSNWRRSSTLATMNYQQRSGNRSSSVQWMGKLLPRSEDTEAILPYLYIYDQTLFGFKMSYVDYALGGSPVRPLARPMEMEEGTRSRTLKDEEVAERTAELNAVKSAELIEVKEVNEENLEKVQLRESDVKTALWKPMLTSDDKGQISVEFEVPNFNTTWIAQAIACNQKTVGTTWMAEVLTQKPLMVRANMPRFLRQGDKAQLAAMVQNATDQNATCDAVIELFDPRSNDVYATRKFNLQLDPMGSQAVKIDWTVPDDIAFVGFRIKAANGNYGDGEQVMVPVLTTISPVIETEPFYVEAGVNHHEVALPKFPADARVTLEYCDNPVWYSVLALPTIFSNQYHVSTQAAHSLYALLIAKGVAKDQPQIKEAVTYWKEHEEDSILVSMLQKNQDLKIGTLLASPWLRDADRQTLRMSKLNELFDEALMTKEYEKIITALQSLQMSDGGFTWFLWPQCKSSIWATGTVLELLGEIKHLGYLPDDSRVTTMLNRAIDYYDSENVKEFEFYKKNYKDPYSHFTDYAYIRTLFPEVKHAKASADLMKKTLKYMDKNWNKGITLKQKGYYAMTLNRNGYTKTARNIVESIRQFAIVKPSLGMYWDNLQTGYGWWEYDKVAYTSTILQAMNEVDPRQEEIDQIRKWMLLMKQSNDWGSYSLAADAVYSILSTGSQWLDRGATPAITVASQPVNLDKMAQWLGYFRTTIDAATAGNVVIDRTAKGPAWGAVYSQFKAPMTQIQEKSIEEISISKEYYVYAPDGTLHSATSFKVGDKVKVRVIIKVNKDMDYVTMTDERAACFEPVDQLSGYCNEDRTWFYLETKDSQTNAFFTSLSKGTHIIGYDVWVTNPGEFTSGIATIQSQYAPQLSAHSAGKKITAVAK